MVESLADARTVVRALLGDESALVRAVLSGRQRNTSVPFRRVEVRYVDLTAGRCLQLTSYDQTQAHTRNVAAGDESGRELDSLLAAGYANWQVETATETVQVRITKKGRPLLHRAARASAVTPDRDHDRAKRRRLDERDDLFAVLGIAGDDGRVKPSRMAKFRQVQDFLAALDPLVSEAVALGPGTRLSEERPLRVVDLGCGNAYLTFAALRYLSAVKQLPVHVVGVDVKAEARGHNIDAAGNLGVADHLEFIDSTIRDATVEHPPDLVLALHACDTATDEALARAVRWQAPVILAAPCCHHDIQRQLGTGTIPEPYRLLTRHGILKERFADVLTDALRAAILRMVGYRVDVIEFVDSEHTPRNALIRAVRTGAGPGAETVAGYRSLLSEWPVRPALASMLSHDYPLLAADVVDAGR
ncbi:MAG: SAM-dependent methyltransferase [Propionibacteriales bacterium]|nr:SAM-dependent methyltransferase [Propionibacteriales bacterium]